MKLHYMGKYNMDPNSLPALEHKPGAVKFKEVENSGQLALVANILALLLLVIFSAVAFMRVPDLLSHPAAIITGLLASLLTLVPHECLHAICFKKDVYLYMNLSQGMAFVVGPESMTKNRFVFMSLLPNLVFGFFPFILGLIFPQLTFCIVFGLLCITMGAGDYYNVFNALTQMPKGAYTYLHKLNSYWYIPENTK